MRRLCYIVMLLLACACTTQTRYYQYRPVNDKAWHQSDTISFDVQLDDSIHSHQLEVGMRYTKQYPYQNFKIGVIVLSSDSQFLSTQNIVYQITDEAGNYLGSGQNSLYQLTSNPIILSPFAHGSCIILLNQRMNDSIISGIHDVGIKISRK